MQITEERLAAAFQVTQAAWVARNAGSYSGPVQVSRKLGNLRCRSPYHGRPAPSQIHAQVTCNAGSCSFSELEGDFHEDAGVLLPVYVGVRQRFGYFEIARHPPVAQ